MSVLFDPGKRRIIDAVADPPPGREPSLRPARSFSRYGRSSDRGPRRLLLVLLPRGREVLRERGGGPLAVAAGRARGVPRLPHPAGAGVLSHPARGLSRGRHPLPAHLG